MSKAYSNDLRERVIKNYEEGMPKEKEELKKYVEANPSATLEPMGKHFKVRTVSIWHRLKKLGITMHVSTNLQKQWRLLRKMDTGYYFYHRI